MRFEPGLRAAALTEAPHAWVRWDAGNETADVLQAVMPIHGVELFSFHAGRWHRFGRTLPAFDFRGDLDYQPLSHVLFPAPVQPIAAWTDNRVAAGAVWRWVSATIGRARTTALLCPLASRSSAWSDTVPSGAGLASLQGIGLDDQADSDAGRAFAVRWRAAERVSGAGTC